jgi:hypothetical protein
MRPGLVAPTGLDYLGTSFSTGLRPWLLYNHPFGIQFFPKSELIPVGELYVASKTSKKVSFSTVFDLQIVKN